MDVWIGMVDMVGLGKAEKRVSLDMLGEVTVCLLTQVGYASAHLFAPTPPRWRP